MSRIAGKLGFSFVVRASPGHLNMDKQFQLLTCGRKRHIRNLMIRNENAMTEEIFDYFYQVGHGRHSHEHRQTVFLIRSNAINLPAFQLNPESSLLKIGKRFGYQDIVIPGVKYFSDKFIIHGRAENEV